MVTTSITKHNLNFEVIIYICSALSFSEYISPILVNTFQILTRTMGSFLVNLRTVSCWDLHKAFVFIILARTHSLWFKMLRLENTSEHSEGTFLLFCEEEHFHVVFSFHKDVSPLLKFEPLKYWELEIYAPTAPDWYHPSVFHQTYKQTRIRIRIEVCGKQRFLAVKVSKYLL